MKLRLSLTELSGSWTTGGVFQKSCAHGMRRRPIEQHITSSRTNNKAKQGLARIHTEWTGRHRRRRVARALGRSAHGAGHHRHAPSRSFPRPVDLTPSLLHCGDAVRHCGGGWRARAWVLGGGHDTRWLRVGRPLPCRRGATRPGPPLPPAAAAGQKARHRSLRTHAPSTSTREGRTGTEHTGDQRRGLLSAVALRLRTSQSQHRT